MLFNSTVYLIFLPLVLFLHFWLRKNLPWRNFLLLTASYFFYGWWSLEFLLLMVLTTSADYFLGRLIAAIGHPQGKRAMLIASLIMNLGVLFCFKYRSFFFESLA